MKTFKITSEKKPNPKNLTFKITFIALFFLIEMNTCSFLNCGEYRKITKEKIRITNDPDIQITFFSMLGAFLLVLSVHTDTNMHISTHIYSDSHM